MIPARKFSTQGLSNAESQIAGANVKTKMLSTHNNTQIRAPCLIQIKTGVPQRCRKIQPLVDLVNVSAKLVVFRFEKQREDAVWSIGFLLGTILGEEECVNTLTDCQCAVVLQGRTNDLRQTQQLSSMTDDPHSVSVHKKFDRESLVIMLLPPVCPCSHSWSHPFEKKGEIEVSLRPFADATIENKS